MCFFFIIETMEEHRPDTGSAAPMKLGNVIMLIPLHRQDDSTKRRQWFALVESGSTALKLPWLMAYTSRGN